MQTVITVRDVTSQFDQCHQSTHMSCSHVTKHGQTGGRIRYVCDGVCSEGRLYEKNPGSCEFFTSRKAGPPNGKCGLENSRCSKVQSFISQERGGNGKQSGGNKVSVSEDQSTFDHSQTCSFSDIFVICLIISDMLENHFQTFFVIRFASCICVVTFICVLPVFYLYLLCLATT